MRILNVGLKVIAVLSLSACAKYDFTPVVPEEMMDKLSDGSLASANMPVATSQAKFKQDSFDENRTSLNFQVVDANGNSVNDLDSTAFVVTENGVNVGTFTAQNSRQQTQKTVDIVFMMDVTCSMSPTLATAKTSVINFINSTRQAGYHTRMCLSTFGDYVVQRCTRFYDNDPSDPSTMTQVQELTAQISQLKALCAAQDPGGPTRDENPLGAIIDAAKAPFAADSQRFGVLMTDAPFLYANGNDNGLVKAPKYADAIKALQTSQMNIFAATPAAAGYNSNFGTQPSLVSASGGEFFLYADLISGAKTFNTILNRILLRVQTNYGIDYIADIISGLDPSLPLSRRVINVTVRNRPELTVRVTTQTSNMPQGRAQYITTWPLSDKEIDANSMIVKVNGAVVKSGYRISNGSLVFSSAPVANAQIEVSYRYKNLKDGLSLKTLMISGLYKTSDINVFFNGVIADSKDYSFVKDLQDHWVLNINDSAFADADPYAIRDNGALFVEIKTK